MRSALIIIDMQNAFCYPNGSYIKRGFNIVDLGKIIKNIKVLLEWARSEKIQIIYTKMQFKINYSDGGMLINKILPVIKNVNGLISNTWDSDIIEDFNIKEDDLIVEKNKYDAFSNNVLDEFLNSNEINHIYVTGVLTDICVESTLRSAVTSEYEVTLISDACSTIDKDRQQKAIERIDQNFGNTILTKNLIKNG